MKENKNGRELAIFMILSENKIVNGFRVIRTGNEESSGHSVLMEHIKTGAHLFWLDNNMENMVFEEQYEHFSECNDFSGYDNVSCFQP